MEEVNFDNKRINWAIIRQYGSIKWGGQYAIRLWLGELGIWIVDTLLISGGMEGIENVLRNGELKFFLNYGWIKLKWKLSENGYSEFDRG